MGEGSRSYISLGELPRRSGTLPAERALAIIILILDALPSTAARLCA